MTLNGAIRDAALAPLCLALLSPPIFAQTSAAKAEVPAFNAVIATAQATERGHFRVKVTKTPVPIPLNEVHTWTIQAETAAGRPVMGAVVSVDGGMPQHSHGLPTQPRTVLVTAAGTYLIDGFKFHMPGYWEVHIGIDSDGVKDKATFRLQLR